VSKHVRPMTFMTLNGIRMSETQMSDMLTAPTV
jgi:hypothetical protein